MRDDMQRAGKLSMCKAGALPDAPRGLGIRDFASCQRRCRARCGTSWVRLCRRGARHPLCRAAMRACTVSATTLAACHQSRRPAFGPSRPGTLCVWDCPCHAIVLCNRQWIAGDVVGHAPGLRAVRGSTRVLQVGGLRKTNACMQADFVPKELLNGTVPVKKRRVGEPLRWKSAFCTCVN